MSHIAVVRSSGSSRVRFSKNHIDLLKKAVRMSKSKSSTKPSTDVLSKVKNASVVKPTQNMKAKKQELAKAIAGKEEKKKKTTKNMKKEPTPEESDSESEESASSAAEDSEDSDSEGESEAEAKPVINGKTNGAKAVKADSSDESEDEEDDSESSDSSDSEDDANIAKAANEAEPSDEDSESDSEVEAKPNLKSNGPIKAAKADASSDDSESDDEADSSDSDEEEEAKSTQPAKRKFEEEPTPTAKKTKTDVAEGQGSNLFVGNLSWNVDEDWLKAEFETFGELASVRLITDRDSGRSKGFGYVEFVNAADAVKAHDGKKGTELDGRAINVDYAQARADKAGGDNPRDRAQGRAKSFGDSQSPPSDTLFVGNLSFEVGQDAVSQAFADYGTIMGVRLPTDRETGQPKGFGYVTFASSDEAKAAMDAMQGYELSGRSIRLDFSQPRPQNGDSPARGRGGFGGGFGGGRGRGGFGDRGGRGGRGRGGFGDRGGRGGRGGSTNRGGFGDFSGRKTTF